MRKFKVGDRVKNLINLGTNGVPVGEIGIITISGARDCGWPYIVNFPSFSNAYRDEYELELVIETNPSLELDTSDVTIYCPLCHSTDLDIVKVWKNIEWGSNSKSLPRGIILKNVMSELTHCYYCGEEFYTYDQSEDYNRRIRDAMVLRIIELEDKIINVMHELQDD